MDEETIKLGVNATPQFIGALTELVWVQIGMLPRDSTEFPPIWKGDISARVGKWHQWHTWAVMRLESLVLLCHYMS